MEPYVDQSKMKWDIARVQEETVVEDTSSQKDNCLSLLVEKLADRVEKLEKGSKKAYQKDLSPPVKIKANYQGR